MIYASNIIGKLQAMYNLGEISKEQYNEFIQNAIDSVLELFRFEAFDDYTQPVEIVKTLQENVMI